MKPELPEGKFYALNRTPGHYVKRVTPDGHEEIYAGVRTYREAQALAAVLNLYPVLMRFAVEAVGRLEVTERRYAEVMSSLTAILQGMEELAAKRPDDWDVKGYALAIAGVLKEAGDEMR